MNSPLGSQKHYMQMVFCNSTSNKIHKPQAKYFLYELDNLRIQWIDMKGYVHLLLKSTNISFKKNKKGMDKAPLQNNHYMNHRSQHLLFIHENNPKPY